MNQGFVGLILAGMATCCIVGGIATTHSNNWRQNSDILKIEQQLKIKEINRYTSAENDVIYGETAGSGQYYVFNKSTNTLSDGKNFYYVNNGKILKLGEQKKESLRTAVLPALSKHYGIEFGGKKDLKTAYILADTSCPFSQKFFSDGGAGELMKDGYRVEVIPMSRHLIQDELLSLSSFNCNHNNEQRKSIFINAIDAKKPINITLNNPTDQCSYWSELKQLYSIFEDYNLGGFPAIIKSDSMEILHANE